MRGRSARTMVGPPAGLLTRAVERAFAVLRCLATGPAGVATGTNGLRLEQKLNRIDYQLDFVTPGIRPLLASSRTAMRLN